MSGRRSDRRSPFSTFGSRPLERFGDQDEVDAMGEKMDRDREAFFADTGEGEPMESGLSDQFPFFRNAPSPRFDGGLREELGSYSSLPRGFRPQRAFSERFSEMGNFPGDARDSSSDMRRRTSSNPNPNGSENPDQNSAATIPIRVIRTKPKYNKCGGGDGGRSNTTHLPAAARGAEVNQTNSAAFPRLERAQSEPPKTFGQKLKTTLSNQPPSTIQENAEELNGGGGQLGRAPPVRHVGQVYLNDPDCSANVPPSTPPSAPPRKLAAATDNPTQGVRHIPIFVEGRDNPVFNRKLNVDGNSTSNTSEESGSAPNVKKPSRSPKLDVVKSAPAAQGLEPTSPISPPVGPIPMGYVPSCQQPQQEEEPIPMPCSSKLMQKLSESEDQKQASDVADAAAPKLNEEAAVAVEDKEEGECKKAKLDPVVHELQNVKNAVAELSEKIASFKGNKADKEYLYLDEMLTRHLLSLDCIEANGRDDIRRMRKDTIRSINRCLSNLDSNAKSSKQDDDDADDDVAATDAIIDELVAKSEKND